MHSNIWQTMSEDRLYAKTGHGCKQNVEHLNKEFNFKAIPKPTYKYMYILRGPLGCYPKRDCTAPQ